MFNTLRETRMMESPNSTTIDDSAMIVQDIYQEGPIRYAGRWKALICRKCQHAVPRISLDRHLTTQHRMGISERRAVLSAFVDLPALQTIEDFPVPDNDGEPIVGLKVSDGYLCRHCGLMVSKTTARVKTHARAEHPEHEDHEVPWKSVSLQQWFPTRKVVYWTVRVPQSLSGLPTLEATSWEARMEQSESERLRRQRDSLLVVSQNTLVDDTTPWLLRTKWPQMFSGRDLKIIGRTRYRKLDTDLQGMFPNCPEKHVRLLDSLFDELVKREKETLQTTPGSLCRWLRSTHRSEPDRRPFKLLQDRKTERTYIGRWKQFLLLCRPDLRRDSGRKVPGLLRNVQKQHGITS